MRMRRNSLATCAGDSVAYELAEDCERDNRICMLHRPILQNTPQPSKGVCCEQLVVGVCTVQLYVSSH